MVLGFLIAVLPLGAAIADPLPAPAKQIAAHDSHAQKIAPQAVPLPQESAFDRVSRMTGCNANGLGPAKFGCDFYSADKPQRRGLQEVSFRGGVNQNQVGVGLLVRW